MEKNSIQNGNRKLCNDSTCNDRFFFTKAAGDQSAVCYSSVQQITLLLLSSFLRHQKFILFNIISRWLNFFC